MTHDSALRDVLTQFRKDFTPGVIEKGKHFNMKILLAAIRLLTTMENYGQVSNVLYFSGKSSVMYSG